MTETQASQPPDRIYLQWPEGDHEHAEAISGPTHSADRINPEDVEYVRAAEIDRLTRERDEARAIAAEGRKAGRAEAAQLLLDSPADEWGDGDTINGLIESYPIGDTGDYGCQWVRDKVLELFDATNAATTSVIERLEEAFDKVWFIDLEKAKAQRDEAARRLAEVEGLVQRLGEEVKLFDITARLRNAAYLTALVSKRAEKLAAAAAAEGGAE